MMRQASKVVIWHLIVAAVKDILATQLYIIILKISTTTNHLMEHMKPFLTKIKKYQEVALK